MLGALHKVTLDIAPPQLAALFPRKGVVVEHTYAHRTRNWRPLHDKQLHSFADIDSTETMRRSLSGLVHSYNFLPQRAVKCNTVKSSQKTPQNALKIHASRSSNDDWHRLCSSGWHASTRTGFDSIFCVAAFFLYIVFFRLYSGDARAGNRGLVHCRLSCV